MQVKNLEEMMKQQDAVRNGIKGTVEDVEANVIVNYFKNMKQTFEQM